MRRQYDLANLEIVRTGQRRASWRWAEHPVSGQEHAYNVIDRNFRRDNRWSFVVQVPVEDNGQIIVRPVSCANRRVWAGLERRAVVFRRAAKRPFRKQCYCKVFLADPSGERNRLGVRYEARELLPEWFEALRRQLHAKSDVATTRAHDGGALVAPVPAEDHAQMIRLYFAMRVWTLQEQFSIA